MIVNPIIKKTFKEISKAAVEYMNKPDVERKYLLKLLRIFKKLEENEQIFILRALLEHVHFRHIITDPDNVIQIHNIKLRTITYIFILAVLFVLITAVLLQTNDSVNEFLYHLNNIFKIIF